MKMLMSIIVLAIGFSLIGCSQQDNNSLNATDNDQNGNRTLQVKNSDPVQRENLTNEEIADHLADVASSVPNVYDAAALVAGPYSVVAINVDKDLDSGRVGTIKYTVAEALKHDPYGKTSVVVADPDIMERIREMGSKIRQGYPVRGVVDELADIVGRVIPEMPVDETRPQEKDQNDEILSDDERQQLNDIQNDQSNQMKNR